MISMRYALDPQTNNLVSLPALARLRSEELDRTSPDEWASILGEGLVCPECGRAVYAYAVLQAVTGFQKAGVEIGNPKAAPAVREGFHHMPDRGRRAGDTPLEKCPLYSGKDDPRFEGLKKSAKDEPAVRALVLAALTRPENANLNKHVLRTLFKRAAEREITDNEVKRYEQMATMFLGTEVLAHHPYLLPYALITMTPFFQRTSPRTGKPYRVALSGVGRQEIPYKDLQGKHRVIVAPEALQLFFKNGKSLTVMDYDRRLYVVDRNAAYTLTGLPLPIRQPPVPATPSMAAQAYRRMQGEEPERRARPQLLPGMPDLLKK